MLTNDNDGDALIVQTLTVTTPGTFSGTYGDLVLNANGSYTYTLGVTPAQQAAVQALALAPRRPTPSATRSATVCSPTPAP